MFLRVRRGVIGGSVFIYRSFSLPQAPSTVPIQHHLAAKRRRILKRPFSSLAKTILGPSRKIFFCSFASGRETPFQTDLLLSLSVCVLQASGLLLLLFPPNHHYLSHLSLTLFSPLWLFFFSSLHSFNFILRSFFPLVSFLSGPFQSVFFFYPPLSLFPPGILSLPPLHLISPLPLVPDTSPQTQINSLMSPLNEMRAHNSVAAGSSGGTRL